MSSVDWFRSWCKAAPLQNITFFAIVIKFSWSTINSSNIIVQFQQICNDFLTGRIMPIFILDLIMGKKRNWGLPQKRIQLITDHVWSIYHNRIKKIWLPVLIPDTFGLFQPFNSRLSFSCKLIFARWIYCDRHFFVRNLLQQILHCIFTR